MLHDRANWRTTARRAALATAALLFVQFDGAPVHAQAFARPPAINIPARTPSINPTVTPHIDTMRIDPNIAGRAVTGLDRTTPRIRSSCSYAYRDSDGECQDRAVTSGGDGGNAGLSGKGKNNADLSGKGKNNDKGSRGNAAQTVLKLPTTAKELVAEYDSSLSEAQVDVLARRHRLVRIGSQKFPLIDAAIGLFRIADGRSVEVASRDFAADASVRSVQPNYRYLLQEQQAALTEGDAAQYAIAKLRLAQAHTLARGMNVTIAVIDSGIDIRHPELANSIADTFDALGSKEGPHLHGTGIAGAIVAHARLVGGAPEARILAVRAFGISPGGAQSTTYVILKGLDYAALHGAQIINMSFAGPKDPLIERGITATAAKGILMVAASGNAGPKSPPLYPAANPNVIAVGATDAQDRLFAASNRGAHIAVVAPGADIFLPAPDEKYQVTSGTSFSAAYVSSLVALMLERNPALKPEEVRAIVMRTARDLGPPGRDDMFGAGEADAYAAVSAAAAPALVPVAAVPDTAAAEKVSGRQDVPGTRALNGAAAAMASGTSAAGDAKRPAAP